MATNDPLSTATLEANANIPAGQAGSPWTAPISADSLTPVAPINLPATNPAPLPEPTTPPTKTLDQYITDLTPTTTGKYEGQANDLLSSLQTLMPELGNKTADTVNAENQAGIPQMNTDLRTLQNDLQNQYIELQRSQKNIMASGLDRAVATAQQRQDYENRSFDYNLGVAKANFLTGNIEAAQKQVDRAISVKYSPIEQEIQNKKDQLQLITPFLNAEEAKIAKAQDRKLADEQQAIAEKKADAKTNLTVALQAGVKTPVVNQNGKFFNARTGETYATPADFFKAQGVSSFEEAYQKGLVTDVNVADLNLVAQAQAKYPDVTIPYNATPQEVAKIIQGSRIYKKETYIAPPSGGSSSILDALLGSGADPTVIADANNQSILAQTGLSIPAFNFLTQGTSALTRLSANDRAAIMQEAQNWANTKGVDISTFQSRYKAYNDTLQKNIERYNNSTVMEGELKGTIQNLSDVADSKNFGKLKVANVAKLFAGEQVNDAATMQYAVHLNQLVSELAGYNAAVQGRTSTDVVDIEEAKRVIKNGISSGSLSGFQNALSSSVEKMGNTLNTSVDRANKQVWDLFGVGDKYQPKTSTSTSSTSVPSGRIKVKLKATGQVGTILPEEFNDKIYEKVQ